MELQVADNCVIQYNNDPWQTSDVEYYSFLVQYIISECRTLGLNDEELPSLIVKYHNLPNPRCSNVEEGRIISLVTEGTYWAQFVYQFAHEYCHHLIDGPMDGELISSFWLEESLCEMASRYMLLKLADRWEHESDTIKEFRNFASSMRRYESIRRMHTFAIDGVLSDWIQKNYATLCERIHHRNLYDSIAQYLLPLFIENQTLWRLLPYLKRVPEKEYVNLRHWIVNVVKPQIPNEIESAFEVFSRALLG